jgi:hypothetical protein
MFDMGAAVDIDAAAPVDAVAAPKTTAAPISARCPSPEGRGRAEGHTCRDEAGADIAGITPTVGVSGIIGVRPVTKHNLRLIVGHVKAVGHRGFDRDDLAALLLLHGHDLLLRRVS